MNKRYDELNKKLEYLHKHKNEDPWLVYTLYRECNPFHNEDANIESNTKFHNLTNKTLFAQFDETHFKNYSKKDLAHLIQEVHNRYISENGWDITRSVKMQENLTKTNNIFDSTFDETSSSLFDDSLIVNSDLIDLNINSDIQSGYMNGKNIGMYILNAVLRETNYIMQYENSIDFALGKQQDPETAFSAATMMIKTTNYNLGINRFSKQSHKSEFYPSKNPADKDCCAYSFYQTQDLFKFNSNYFAIKKINENVDEKTKSSPDYQNYLNKVTNSVLGFEPSSNNKELNSLVIDRKIKSLEESFNYQIKYFEEKLKKPYLKKYPLRDSILNTVKDYMKVDEDGNSLFREKLNKELKELVNINLANKQKMNESKLETPKINSKPKSNKNTKTLENVDEDILGIAK